jgi:hypothetical protein
VWSGSDDVFAIGYLNDLRNPLSFTKLLQYKNNAVLMQTMIKNDDNLKKRTIPVVQIRINEDSSITFHNLDL